MRTVMTQTILDEIVRTKHETVKRLKQAVPLRTMKTSAAHAPRPRDFQAAVQKPGVQLIAEVKRASPSKGVLRAGLDAVAFATCYAQNGAAAISVLTDQPYFQGTLEDLRVIKQAVPLPILRKDFIFDAYQVYEARAAGADAVLLIAAILKDEAMDSLYRLIIDLGMAALVEVHNAAELQRVLQLSPLIIGINNRDLNTFDVSLDTTANLISKLPDTILKVAESGIHTPQDVGRLCSLGVDAMLVGESIVTAPDTGAKVRELLSGGRDIRDQD